VPRPGKPGQPIRDVPLLEWARSVLLEVLGEPPVPAPVGPAPSAAPEVGT
jgi:hypothetical protein